MQALQRHAPQMKEIQKKYKADKQKQNEELMKFYRENKINPAASCLPMLAQFPVFIALYYVLRNFAHEPRSRNNLATSPGCTSSRRSRTTTTAHWGGFVLLVVYVASQMASTLYMSATVDKTQRTIFMLMPLVFVFVIARFPAGLVLYWVTTNLWTVGQGLITRRLVPKVAAPVVERKTSRTPPRDDDGSGNGAETRRRKRRRCKRRRRGVRRKKKAGRRCSGGAGSTAGRREVRPAVSGAS